MKKMNIKELDSKTKEELIEIIKNCWDDSKSASTEVHVINSLDKLKDYPSLQSRIEKVYKKSTSVSIMMFRIYNLKSTDEIFAKPVATNIVNDITNTLKRNIRTTDILIKYNDVDFIIIAANTDKEGINKYALKLNNEIYNKIFNDVSHLKSNFIITEFREDDTLHSAIGRLLSSLPDIEKDDRKNIMKV